MSQSTQYKTQVVILDSSSNEDIFVCGLCKLVFNSLTSFIDHKNIQCIQHESHNSYVSQQSVETSVYQSHIQISEQSYNDISCSMCKKKFKRLKCLYSHLKLHEKPSQCLVCGRCFENTSHLKRHQSTHKVWPDGLSKTTPKSLDVELLSYSCSYCDAVLLNYSQFRAHLNNHLILKKFKCIQGECNDFFDTTEDLLTHVSVTHSITKYTCFICKKVYFSLNDIAAHYNIHNGSLDKTKVTEIHQYKCSQCDATFRKPEKLSLHLLTETHNKSCIHCKKAFVSDKRLRMHLQIHKKSKPFKCDICNSSFHMKKYLTSHKLKHGDRQFKCVVCKLTFKRPDILQRHMGIHTKRTIFKCPFKEVNNCTREFTRKDKLKQHLKTHAKNKKSTSKSKVAENIDSGTLEICIVPLDPGSIESNDEENEEK